MLHPKQFEVNEAWIAFRLNGSPVRTERDGDFNCLALMDAASCFILGSEFIPITAAEPTRAQLRRLLKNAQRHKEQLPNTTVSLNIMALFTHLRLQGEDAWTRKGSLRST
jgi:hypothetical protein